MHIQIDFNEYGPTGDAQARKLHAKLSKEFPDVPFISIRSVPLAGNHDTANISVVYSLFSNDSQAARNLADRICAAGYRVLVNGVSN